MSAMRSWGSGIVAPGGGCVEGVRSETCWVRSSGASDCTYQCQREMNNAGMPLQEARRYCADQAIVRKLVS